MNSGEKRHFGQMGILSAPKATQAQKRSENTFKNKVSSADSSPRHRFALINGVFSTILDKLFFMLLHFAQA
jgi:hypothetical protein